MQTLSGVLPRDGRLPEPLRAGSRAADGGGARRLGVAATPGVEDARRARARGRPTRRRPRSSTSARWAEPSVDVNGARGRLAAAPEDGDPGRRRGERLDPARARPGPRRDRARGRAAAPRGGSGGRRGRDRALVVGAARPDPARLGRDPARPGRVRARARRAAAARSAPAARCRSSRRWRTRASRRSSPASTCPRGTSTRRTSGCWSSTSRSASPPRGSCIARSPGCAS